MLSTLASRKLCGHLHDLNGFGTDELSIEELVCQIANAVHIGKLLGEGTDADRTAAHDPVVAEIIEGDP